jgi:hypothetical protein
VNQHRELVKARKSPPYFELKRGSARGVDPNPGAPVFSGTLTIISAPSSVPSAANAPKLTTTSMNAATTRDEFRLI